MSFQALSKTTTKLSVLQLLTMLLAASAAASGKKHLRGSHEAPGRVARSLSWAGVFEDALQTLESLLENALKTGEEKLPKIKEIFYEIFRDQVKEELMEPERREKDVKLLRTSPPNPMNLVTTTSTEKLLGTESPPSLLVEAPGNAGGNNAANDPGQPNHFVFGMDDGAVSGSSASGLLTTSYDVLVVPGASSSSNGHGSNPPDEDASAKRPIAAAAAEPPETNDRPQPLGNDTTTTTKESRNGA